jgi:hypothetical protein
MVQHAFDPASEPALRFSNALSRETNRRPIANVARCLTPVERRLRERGAGGSCTSTLSSSTASR